MTASLADIAREMEITEKQLRHALDKCRSQYSLHAAPTPRGDHFTLLQKLGSKDPGFQEADNRDLVEHLMRVLHPRQKEVITLWMGGLNFREIGEQRRVSKEAVNEHYQKACKRMRGCPAASED